MLNINLVYAVSDIMYQFFRTISATYKLALAFFNANSLIRSTPCWRAKDMLERVEHFRQIDLEESKKKKRSDWGLWQITLATVRKMSEIEAEYLSYHFKKHNNLG